METSPLRSLRFDNQIVQALPYFDGADVDVRAPVAALPGAVFSRAEPSPIEDPEIVLVTQPLLEDLFQDNVLPADGWDFAKDPEAAALLSGSELIPGAKYSAHCYAGFQFGYFSGQLGDGATMYVGEVIGKDGVRHECQFKGAGLTPFSRQADGRKVLRSSMREFLASEHMHALGVPTTRAASLVMSRPSCVVRDQFYDGRPKREPTAVVMRVAPSFLRFGSFEIARPVDGRTGRAGPSRGDVAIVQKLFAYASEKYFPPNVAGNPREFLLEIARSTGKLVATWTANGFCHGVLNTDNMSILGLTIDYGPYGFMERFDPQHVCNTSDEQGRYAFDKQVEVCEWNLLILRDTLLLAEIGKVGDTKLPEIDEILSAFNGSYDEEHKRAFCAKLGLNASSLSVVQVQELVKDLFKVMHLTASDFTITFRALADFAVSSERSVDNFLETEGLLGSVRDLQRVFRPHYMESQLLEMAEIIKTRQGAELLERQAGISPAVVRAEIFRVESSKRFASFTNEDSEKSARNAWTQFLREVYEPILRTHGLPSAELRKVTLRANPRFVLRNHVALRAISSAMEKDHEELSRIFALCQNPFEVEGGSNPTTRFTSPLDGFRYDLPAQGVRSESLCAVSCSS